MFNFFGRLAGLAEDTVDDILADFNRTIGRLEKRMTELSSEIADLWEKRDDIEDRVTIKNEERLRAENARRKLREMVG